jgi:pimeloyl-ACP methyl ester carboxylesterase
MTINAGHMQMNTVSNYQAMKSVIAVVVALTLTGCTSWIADQIAKAPGSDRTNYIIGKEARESFAEAYGFKQLDVEVGPPEARLALTVINPRDYGLEYQFHEYSNDTIEVDFELREPEQLGGARHPAKGTVIILPGMLQSRYTMTFWGVGLAQRGYRVVLADLRGHGESSGQYLTYGLVESRDTIQIIEALESAAIAEPPMVLLGASYGASTALMAAAESKQIDAVVAFAPFTDAASSIEHLARTMFPRLSRMISEKRMAAAIDQASEISGEDIRQARAIDVVDRIDVPVLFVHGREDTWVPPRNSFDLYRSANGSASLLVIPDAGHMDLPMRYDQFSDRVFDWLDKAVRDHAPAVTASAPRRRPE